MNETKMTEGPNDLDTLAKHAPSAIAATTDAAKQKFGDIRQRVVATVDSAKQTARRVRDQAVDHAKAADKAMHENPYKVLGIALAVGAILSYLVLRRRSRHAD